MPPFTMPSLDRVEWSVPSYRGHASWAAANHLKGLGVKTVFTAEGMEPMATLATELSK